MASVKIQMAMNTSLIGNVFYCSTGPPVAFQAAIPPWR
jgi:hypothetical protein